MARQREIHAKCMQTQASLENRQESKYARTMAGHRDISFTVKYLVKSGAWSVELWVVEYDRSMQE